MENINKKYKKKFSKELKEIYEFLHERNIKIKDLIKIIFDLKNVKENIFEHIKKSFV